jgi:hypothetical protein
MASYEWTLGDGYGEHKEPAYHAVSRTWGRWQVSGPGTAVEVLAWIDQQRGPGASLEVGRQPGIFWQA